MTSPERINTNVSIPEEVVDVSIIYNKNFDNGRPIRYRVKVSLYDKNNKLIGIGESNCNCEKETPSKMYGRDKAVPIFER